MKLLPEIKKAIECYNLLYPNMYIEWSETPKELRVEKKLLNNTSIIHFNRVINGKSYPYSQIDIISLNDRVIAAGLSAFLLYVDELQDISYEWISKQAIPMLSAYAGVCIFTGTSNNSPDSALYRYYKSDTIPEENKILLDWKKVYNYKKYISQEHADRYKVTVENQIAEKGEFSTVVQTEWFCNFNITTDKFLSIEQMRNDNMFTEELEDNISKYTEKDTYRIGVLDPAISGDRCAFGLGLSGFLENLTWVKAKNFEVMKELGDTIDPDTIINDTIMLCNKNKLDYLVIDNTASQKYLTIPLYKKMLQETKTQLIPLDTSGFNEKVKMCRYNEGLVMQQVYKLPKEEYREQNKGFKYTVDELQLLEKKYNNNGEYSYRASKNFNDDFAMVYFMLGYALKYLKDSIEEKKSFTLGNHNHRLYLRKNSDLNENKNKETISTWWSIPL